MIDLYPAGSRPSRKAPEQWFTGEVWMDPIITAPAPARINALRVSFAPGARTAWHTHPLGQTLNILSGVGLIGLRDEPPREMHSGDTIWIPPGVEHWHGAAAETGMVHLALQEEVEGSAADWLEHVSDADYLRSTEKSA
ncbi:cupin domain-containing protein [Pseudophaeobacter sp.]|uniref:(R)-mandelonitrile lyase n=1 Tax=Pseudophaeobacter sp. TaxID=1971739 RepID=UPI0032998FC7